MRYQDKNTTVILPCPVCWVATKQHRDSLDERYAYAQKVTYICATCDLSAGAIGDTSKDGYANNSKVEDHAIENWNKKANSPVIAKFTARIAELEAEAVRLKADLDNFHKFTLAR